MEKKEIYCPHCDDMEINYIIDYTEEKTTIDYLSYIQCRNTGKEIKLYKIPGKLEELVKVTGGKMVNE